MARILVVDDRPANREYLVTLLGYQKHQLFEASDGAEGLSVVRKERPDLVITDILMPTMDGYEFVRQIRADPEISRTSVIFFTANYHREEAESLARGCGVRTILTKPCEPQVLLKTVEECLAASTPPAQRPSDEFEVQHLRVITDKLSQTAEELLATNNRLAAMVEVNLVLASERVPQELLQKVCAAARDLIGSKYALMSVDPKNGHKEEYFFTSGMDQALTTGLGRLVLGEGAASRALAEGVTFRHSQVKEQGEDLGLPSTFPVANSVLLAPIVSVSRTYGWICLCDRIGSAEFSEEDARMLGILAAQAGRIYENGSLYAEVQRHAAVLITEIERRRSAQAALADSEQRFREMAENIKDAFFLSDASGERLLYVSPAYEEIWGRASASLRRNPHLWTDAVHAEDRPRVLAAYREGLATGEFEFECRIQRPDGTLRWVKVRAFPVRDETGHLARIASVATDITAQKQSAMELRESERRFHDVLANAEMISTMLDRDGRLTYCNDYLLRLTGWQREEVIGRGWLDIFVPPENQDVKPLFATLLEDKPEARHHENEILTRSGARRLIRWSNSALRATTGEVIGTASLGEDITEQKDAELRIRRLNRVYAVLSGINTLIVHARSRAELFERACEIAVQKGKFPLAWIGLLEGRRLKVPLAAWVGDAPAYRERVESLLSEPGSTNSPVRSVITERTALVVNDVATDPRVLLREDALKNGFRSFVVLPLSIGERVVGLFTLCAEHPGFFDDEEMTLLNELAGDLSFALQHLQTTDRLSYLAEYDELTGLANRTLFLQRLDAAIEDAKIAGHRVAVAMIDIERFRNINDSLGRAAGDDLLKQIAAWFVETMRGAQAVARVGGDHFAILLPITTPDGDAVRVLEEHRRALLQKAFRLKDMSVRAAFTAGTAIFPDDGTDADLLLKNAESALWRAKARAEPVLYYSPEMNDAVVGTLTLENELREAIEKGEFVLHYQPKVSLTDGKLTGAEALIRWNDPRRGLIPPAQFMPILEKTGLVFEVGRWCVRQALEDWMVWRSAGLPVVRIAVNVSPRQLRSPSFAEEIRQAVLINPQASQGLELEITESLIMDNVRQSIVTLEKIRALGVTIAIDDFGTGFSSLSYLARLPVDTLKINRAFVVEMTKGPQGLSLVSTIIALARSLHLKAVAEGVETEEQARLLRLLNCDDMQGFLFSKGVPAQVFAERFLRNSGHRS